MKVAQVGMNKRRTNGDLTRWMMAVDWLLKNGLLDGHIEHDVVNLRYGRDYLAENTTHDIVVLHNIFDGKDHGGVARHNMTRSAWEAIRTSPRQSTEAWRERLAASGAKVVFVFEMTVQCVNGWQLGDIDGYERRHIDTDYAVYVRR